MLRLQQILTLRHLGFALNEIHALLESPVYDLQQSLEVQKQSIDEQIRGLQQVSEALGLAIEAAAALKEPDMALVGTVIQGLRASDASVAWLRQHYSAESLEKLEAVHGKLSVAEVAQGVEAWAELHQAFVRVKHLPPDHPDVQALAAQNASACSGIYTGRPGNRGVAATGL